MNSGKSTILLQAAFNYSERNMKIMLFIPRLMETNLITSRIGLQKEAHVFDTDDDLFEIMKKTTDISCILIDEAQFLTKEHVLQLCKVCDILKIPVMCYGLRSDFMGEPFEGSKYLLTLADKLSELKTICICGNKATMNMRKVESSSLTNLTPILEGAQVDIGGNEKYISLCRKCYAKFTSIY